MRGHGVSPKQRGKRRCQRHMPWSGYASTWHRDYIEYSGDQCPGLPASGKLGFASSGYIHDAGTSYSIWGGYHIYYTANASPRGPMSDVARNPTTHQPSRDIRLSSYENRRDTMRCTPSVPKNMMVCRRDERDGAKSSLKRSPPPGRR